MLCLIRLRNFQIIAFVFIFKGCGKSENSTNSNTAAHPELHIEHVVSANGVELQPSGPIIGFKNAWFLIKTTGGVGNHLNWVSSSPNVIIEPLLSNVTHTKVTIKGKENNLVTLTAQDELGKSAQYAYESKNWLYRGQENGGDSQMMNYQDTTRLCEEQNRKMPSLELLQVVYKEWGSFARYWGTDPNSIYIWTSNEPDEQGKVVIMNMVSGEFFTADPKDKSSTEVLYTTCVD